MLLSIANDKRDVSVPDFLTGGGELGALMRAHDWASTPLGAPESWPQSLRMSVRIMLTSLQPIWIGWGDELIYMYNDAYKSIIGGKHPWALGRPTKDVWREIWSDIDPMLQTALGGERGTYVESQLLIMERNGYPEETYYTFSYSPIPDEQGRAGGIFCANSDDTARVIGERQLSLLRELAASTATVRNWQEACQQSARALATNPRDLPFSLLYLGSHGAAELSLLGSSGFLGPHAGAPSTLRLDQRAPWPAFEALRTHELQLVDLASLSDQPFPSGAWQKAPTLAAVLPVSAAGETGRFGVLIVGLNPFRIVDEGYRGFLGLSAGQIASALSSAQAYEDERRKAEALAELDRAKTTFFSNVSHEFRTPLTLMLGPIEDMLTQQLDQSDHTRQQLAVVHRNGMRLLRLVNSLLDFSRIEAGRMQASFEPTDIGAFSADIAAIFRSAIEKAGLSLVVDAEPLPSPVYLDRDMWEKILINLLSNAFKFTHEGEIRVSIAASKDGRSVVVSVADTGIGVPSDELPRLFERFHRVEGAQGRSIEGTGIGLALVQELVRLHGGTIKAESQLGKGTTFTISLPFGSEHLPSEHIHAKTRELRPLGYGEQAIGVMSSIEKMDDLAVADVALPSASAEETLSGTGKRIVLADDNADMREYVVRLLISQGYAVEAVEDGEAALATIRERAPDLVLSDVMMPKLDGFGLLRAIREDAKFSTLPVLLLSARAGEEAKVEGLVAQADDYLSKPFTAKELIARVNSNIQLAEFRRAAAQAQMRFVISQDRLNRALATGRVAVYDWDVESDRLSVLGPLAEAFGVDSNTAAEGLPLTRFFQAIHPDDQERTAAQIQNTIRTEAPFDCEYRVHSQGEMRVFISRGTIERRSTGEQFFSGVLIDVTEEKAIEAKLHEINATLEQRVIEEVGKRTAAEDALRQAQKMEAIGQLTGGVAHDFNNLLTVIMGGLETIRRARPDDHGRIMRASEMALQGTQRAASLTSRLLAFSRRQPLDPKPLDLNLLVRDMTELLHRSLGEQIELEGVMAPRLWMVEIDKNQLESAILNLAVNSRDAMPNGGKLTIETANTALDDRYAQTDAEVIPGQYVMLSITDNGDGMTADTLARAFEPFFTTKEVGRGTGLGLSMVYGFVKQSGGHVTIYSEPDHGTTVKLYFPRYKGPHAALVQGADVHVPGAGEGEVVLVVEDNEDVRNYSASVLTELGYAVLEAAHSDAAEQIIRANGRIDLLFTDVVLPGKSGRLLADFAKQIRPRMPVLYTTGYSRNAIVHHGRLDADVNLITKPFTFDQLAVKVRDAIDRNRT